MAVKYLYGTPTVNAEFFWESKKVINGWQVQYCSSLDVFFSPFKCYRLLCPKNLLWASGDSVRELEIEISKIRTSNYKFAIEDTDIYNVLEKANREELQKIVEILCTKFSCAIKKNCSDIAVIVDELQTMGGNTIANQVRRHGVKYQEILEDVIAITKTKITKESANVMEMEDMLIENLVLEAEKKMTDEEKKAFYDEINEKGYHQKFRSFADILKNQAMFHSIRLIITELVLKQLLQKLGISYATKFVSTRGASALLGPIGMALGGVWLLLDLAGPAYSVTLPSVLMINMIRHRIADETGEEILNY